MDIALLKKGDQRAFQELIDSTHSDVFRLAVKFTSNRDDAKDIAQEVYLEAFRNIRKFREDANIRTWLYRITVNRSLNLIKRNKTKFQSLSIDSDSESIKGISAPVQHGADKPLENKELRRLLNAALDKLPENQRTAFLLFNHDGISYNEIADILNTSLSAVESLIFRSKANLRKLLGDYYEKNYRAPQVLKPTDVK
ncbi:MAG: RNA polymerase sigma factor [Bacteroidales bacterium]|jgi:RNA polymerase sigma-70 factor (ECF subfamily)|nr:RNA polymerase sigma factor [Bacteroidales bacterium]